MPFLASEGCFWSLNSLGGQKVIMPILQYKEFLINKISLFSCTINKTKSSDLHANAWSDYQWRSLQRPPWITALTIIQFKSLLILQGYRSLIHSAVHSVWKGIFNYFQFSFFVARSMHLNITRYMKSNKVEIVEFQGRKMKFQWYFFIHFCQIQYTK